MGCHYKPSVPVVQFLEEQQHFNACNRVTMRKNGCETDCLPQGMSICPVPTDGFKKLKNLKVLTRGGSEVGKKGFFEARGGFWGGIYPPLKKKIPP